MRLSFLLSALITLVLVGVVLATDARAGLAQPPHGDPTRTPTRSPAAVETEPEIRVVLPRIQQNNDGPDKTEMILLTLGIVGAAAVLSLVGYVIRQRVGFWPHRPPPHDATAPEEHH